MLRLWPLVPIVLAAVVVRALFLREAMEGPGFFHPGLDALFHDHMARGWALGDWTLPVGTPDPEVRTTPLQRPLGYPALLALFHRVSGGSLLLPRLVNVGLGALTAVLVVIGAHLATRRRALAALAGGLFVLAPLPLFFEAELVAAPLAAFLLVFTLVLGARVVDDKGGAPRWGMSLGLGLAIGLLGLVRPNYAVLALFVPAAIAVLARGRRRVGEAAVVIALGLAPLVATPVVNATSGNEALPMPVNGGLTLLYGNNARATGFDMVLPDDKAFGGFQRVSPFEYPAQKRALERAAGHALSHAEAGRLFREHAIHFWTSEPLAALELTAKKALLFFGPEWVSNNRVVALARDESRVLSSLPVDWWWLFPLALVSLLALARRPTSNDPRGGARAVVVMGAIIVASAAITTIPFVAAARFRAPLVPVLCVLAAVGVDELLRRRAERTRPLAAAMVLGCGALLSVPNWLGYHPDAGRYYLERARAELRADRKIDARASLERAYEEGAQAEARVALGYLALDDKDPGAAVRAFEEAAAKEPQNASAHAGFGAALVLMGRAADGLAHIDRALELRPDLVELHYNRGLALFRLGRLDEAAAAYETALAARPHDAAALNNLGRTRLALGDAAGALVDFERAARAAPGQYEARFNRGVALLRLGRAAEAVAVYAALVDEAPTNADARLNLCAAHLESGAPQTAVACGEDFVARHPADARVIPLLEAARTALVGVGGEADHSVR